MTTAAFIGLGTMGYPMAGHLAAAGHDMVVYNRSTPRALAWVEQHGGRHEPTAAAAAATADLVFVCVGNDDDLRSVVLGDQGALSTMGSGTVLVDHTTASATVARELAGLAADRGVGFLDAPISGGQSGAEAGQLTVMCGGDADSYAAAEPLIGTYSASSRLLGSSGAGQLTKMVNQIAIAGVIQGLAEAIDFGLRAGLDMDAAIEVVSNGAAGSWQMHNRGPTMIADQFDFGFAVEWMRKDLGICLDEAERNGASLDLVRLVDGYYEEIIERGGERWDTSSLIRRLR